MQMQIYFTAIIKESDSFRQKKRHVQKARIFSKTFRFIERNSHQRCSMKKGVLRNFTKFTGKHLCQSLFFNKVADLRLATFLKRGSGIGVFLWFLRNFLEHPFYRTPLDDCCSLMMNLKIIAVIFILTSWNSIKILERPWFWTFQ